MENKYFTPDIEDIRIGYEYENLYSNGEWKKDVVEWSEIKYQEIEDRSVRVAYLTKEQIEAEGWEYKQTNKIRCWYGMDHPEKDGNWYGYSIYRATLIHDPQMNYVKILFSFDSVEDECVFEGECKDVNTLRMICKLLKMR